MCECKEETMVELVRLQFKHANENAADAPGFITLLEIIKYFKHGLFLYLEFRGKSEESGWSGEINLCHRLSTECNAKIYPHDTYTRMYCLLITSTKITV